MILKTAKTHYVFEGGKLEDWPRDIQEMKERHFARIFAMPQYSFEQVFHMDRQPLETGGYSFIQRFKIVSYAGAGGSAVVVYCVKKEDEMRRLFVAKCIKHGMNTTNAEMNVFNKLIKRPHPSLCKLDSVFTDTRATHLLLILGTGRLYSELSPPEPRQDLFAITDSYEPGTFPVERICEGMTQLVDGLLWLLDLGFCHGDIKDENVVVSEVETGRFPASSFDISNKWQWTWIDFGSAKKADALVPCSSFLGTFHYMAPEIADGNYKSNESMDLDEMYDPKKQDVWALGLVLYGMLFGGDAFSSHSDALLYDWDHLVTFDIFNNRRVARRSKEGEILDERYYDRLSKMLNKNPGDRADLKYLTSWF
jgi:serine/threonine protein kinase